MNFINYATEAAQTVTRDWTGFFKTINENMAVIGEFSARGLGFTIAGDKGVPEGEGYKSVFDTLGAFSTSIFNLSSEKK